MAEPPKLIERVRRAIRARHYSRRTEEAYVVWIRRYIVYHGKVHPSELGHEAVTAFLAWLAVERGVSASTQNQALSAVLFLYREVLRIDPGPIDSVPRARVPGHVPVVLSVGEARAVMAHVAGVPWLVVALLYGAGLRLQECLELRVKDIDFERREVVVRRGKGRKDRRTMLPEMVQARLRTHLEAVRRQHDEDLAEGCGRVALPEALERKFPNAATDWLWQFVFPARRICRDQRWGPPTRFHLHESVVQRAVAAAARSAGLTKRVGCHTFRHSFATHLGVRHSHGAGAAGACGREHDNDLHARAEPGRAWREESSGSAVSVLRLAAAPSHITTVRVPSLSRPTSGAARGYAWRPAQRPRGWLRARCK